MKNGKATPATDPMSPPFQRSFERLQTEIRALNDEELQHINVNVPAAVTTVMGVVPKLNLLRQRMQALPEFDLARFDALEAYAQALAYAHALYRIATEPVDDVPALAAEVVEARGALMFDAGALARRKLLDGARASQLRSPSGYKNIAFDVLGLVSLFRERWTCIEGMTAVKLEELESAEHRAERLLTAVGLREQAPAAVNAAANVRQRAYTLLMRAYDDARRAVQYLRWHDGDADQIAPSLFAGRGNGRRKNTDTVKSGDASRGTETSESPGLAANPSP